MKVKFVLSIAVLTTIISSCAPSDGTNANNNYYLQQHTAISGALVSYNFNENSGSVANNSAVNGRWTGNLSGVVRIDSPNGKALSFSNQDSYVDIDTMQYNVNPDTLQFPSNNVTIEALIRVPSVVSGAQTIFGSNQSMKLQLMDGKPSFSICGLNGGCNNVLASETVLGTNQWYHIALTYNGSDALLYIDGTLDKQNNISYGMSAAYNAYLGKFPFVSEHFIGDIDEFRLLNVVLSATEIEQDSNALSR